MEELKYYEFSKKLQRNLTQLNKFFWKKYKKLRGLHTVKLIKIDKFLYKFMYRIFVYLSYILYIFQWSSYFVEPALGTILHILHRYHLGGGTTERYHLATPRLCPSSVGIAAMLQRGPFMSRRVCTAARLYKLGLRRFPKFPLVY